jgi:cytochrome c biogenesis factor
LSYREEQKIKGEVIVKKVIGMVVSLIGVAILAMGIVFMAQSNTAKKTVANEISPIAVKDVNATYDTLTTHFDQYMQAEEPNIQAGKAAPTATYDYFAAQRALMAQAKANLGLAGFVMMTGVVNIVLGLGLILAGMALYMKPTA